ncbi:methyltransferase domain-containing protein [uncultured Rikenella sp.]|uniref:methyltransferase domain-containing protein n=1 Tax=uncultured Rikenella sp. TaxID=368003 RepID=UPI00262C1324|nr:methyltransferase domain-containing protein [uncultured Rikenella sp.]
MKHDKELLQRRFARNLATYETGAVVQRTIAERLAGRLAERIPAEAVRRGVEIGAGTGFLTRRLVALFPGAAWTANDLVPESGRFLPPEVAFEAGDGEHFPFGEARYDLIATASTVQWFDDLPTFAARAARGLRRGGLLAVGTFGPENFREITATTGLGLEYYSLSELSEIFISNHLQITDREERIEPVPYPTPLDVLRHLRRTGVNAVAAERWTRGRLRRFDADYRAVCAGAAESAAEGVTLTFHPTIIIAQKP